MKLLLDALNDKAQTQPDKTLFTFLDDGGSPLDSLTYKDVLLKTEALAEHLMSKESGLELKRGDCVLLVFEPSLHFIVSFLACARAGLVAVPVFPPDPRKLKKDMFMFVSIADTSQARVALTTKSYNSYKKMADLRNMFESVKWPDLKWMIVDDLKLYNSPPPDAACSQPHPNHEDLCFLQFTSGSTSEPKGVMITHECLAHNLSMIIHELEARDDTVVVSWLPQYHDMGLIGSYLGTMYCGGCGYYMSPFSFLKNPLVWMRCISKYQGTHMQAPNFAFALAVRKLRESKQPAEDWDLSSVRHMINAAEPVNHEDIETFYDLFGKFGLKRGVVFPTYGLAEHTVFVCSGGQQMLRLHKSKLEGEQIVVEIPGDVAEEGEEGVSWVVGCGFPFRERPAGVESVRVAIVAESDDEEGSSFLNLGQGRVGEVWLHSPSCAKGYFNNPEKTKEDFHAKISAGDSTEWLRTGDLGFLYKDELFITGRMKDLIIVRGRNHYPQDIERTVDSAGEGKLRPGRSAAFDFKSRGGVEQVAVIAELRNKENKRTCEELVTAIRTLVSQDHGVQLAAVVLCKDRTIPITSSGKIARQWCKKAFLKDSLEAIHTFKEAEAPTRQQQQPSTEEDGVEMMGEAINVEELDDDELLTKLIFDISEAATMDPDALESDLNAPLVSLGLDSLALSQVKGLLEHKYSCTVPDQWLYFDSTNMQQVLAAVRLGGVSEEAAEGTVLSMPKTEDSNCLLQTCPCMLMCCPNFVMNWGKKADK